MRRVPAVLVAVALATAAAVAVQQRSVAADWRGLEQERAQKASHELQAAQTELARLREERAQLQTRLDEVAADRAAAGDKAAALALLGTRSAGVRAALAACDSGGDASRCAAALYDADQFLAAVTRFAQR